MMKSLVQPEWLPPFFFLTLSLLSLSTSPARADEPAKTPAKSTPSDTPAERTIRILQALNGKWEYSDTFHRSFEMEFNNSGYKNGDESRKEPTKGVNLEANTVATGHIEKIRPLDHDLFCTATKATIVDKKLVLDSIIKKEHERYRIEILDMDKIDANAKEIRMRVTLPKNQSMVWYRSGTTLLFKRKVKSDSSKP